MSDDYFYLCCACGGIAPASEYEALKRDYESDGELVPIEDGDYDPLLRCPLCRHLHTDDDGNPGIEDGTRAAVEAARARYLADPIWAEAWTA